MRALPGKLGAVGPWLSAQRRFRVADSIGTGPRIYGRPIIRNSGQMVIGDRLQLFSVVSTSEIVVGAGGTLTIGDQCLMMDGTTIAALGNVRIGDFCMFGRQTQILDSSFHYLDPSRRLESPPPEPVDIGNNVWLASRVTVLPGVTIGDGAAVAAGAVVASDVAAKTLVGGVPARKLRDL